MEKLKEQSPIEWFNSQMVGSGVAEKIAGFAGIELTPTGYEIPYYDIKGNDTGIAHFRRFTTDKDNRYFRIKGLGLPPRCYWPRHPILTKPHSTLLGADIGHELWVTEGEKKSLGLQSALLAQGIPASVVSMPGVSCYSKVIEETEDINFHQIGGGGLVKRRVVLCYDWNKHNTMVRASEGKLYDYFTERGAEVVVLRWRGAGEEEQKIDDWLVAGGNLEEALRDSPPYDGGNVKLHDFNLSYAVCNGGVLMLASGVELSKSQFLLQSAQSFEVTDKGRVIPTGERWLRWPERNTVQARGFWPVPIGNKITRYENSRYNTSPDWPDCGESQDFAPFEKHLSRFCESDEQYQWLRRHIAHMFLFPHEVTSNALCFADGGNTGKGILMGILRNALGQLYTEATAEEITGRFNSNIAAKLMVVYDEPAVDRFKNLEAACKKIVGNPMITVEGKGTKAYMVENRIRFIITCNLTYAARLDSADRRWNYFGGTKMTPDEISSITNWTAGDWRWWAQSVYNGDWGDYSPNRLGPVSKLRETAIKHAQSVYLDILEDEQLEGKDIWPTSAINLIANQYVRSNPTKLGMELTKLGFIGHVIKVGGKHIRVRAVRNADRWAAATHEDIAAEYGKCV